MGDFVLASEEAIAKVDSICVTVFIYFFSTKLIFFPKLRELSAWSSQRECGNILNMINLRA